MSKRTAAILALILSLAGDILWIALPTELRLLRAILIGTILFVILMYVDLLRFKGSSRTESTMGAAGDVLIGFQARVVSVEPLRVEARGSVWSARLTGGPMPALQAYVEVVEREGLTLLVRN